MRTVLLLLLALAAPAFASQTVWKWVDEHGVTHYSDRPVPGATKIELNVGGSSSSGDAAPISGTTSGSPAPAAPSGPPYRNFEIWKPGPGETVSNTGGQVSVNVRIEPPPLSGHQLSLYLDGKLVEGFPENTTSYELQEVPRGEHTVVAVVTDRRGARVQQTEPVRFMVRQTSVAQPPVGPALRPPPKPRPLPSPRP